MSAAATQAPIRVNTRRVPRFPLAVPADVTVLRSGIPHSIPGRSVTIGTRGLGVVLAGEVHPGDSVGIEFRLPDSGGRLRLKAIVRYQALLHCGLEFQNLTAEQETLIEHWTRKKFANTTKTPAPQQPPAITTTAPRVESPIQKTPIQKTPTPTSRRTLWPILATALLLIGGLGWWHWHTAWSELESQLPSSQPRPQQPPPTVPAEVMQTLLTHKVEPIYPEAARQAKIQGVVVLDAVVAADGSVIEVHPVSGPDQLTPAAVDAVKWWRFQPYRINGQPIEVQTRLAVDFRRD
jgi:TonB family protein